MIIIITITEKKNTLACTTYLGNSTVKISTAIESQLSQYVQNSKVASCFDRSQVTLSILLSIYSVNTMSFFCALIATMINTIQFFFVKPNLMHYT